MKRIFQTIVAALALTIVAATTQAQQIESRKSLTLDGAKALPLGLLELALKAQGPAEEGVRLRRGAHRDGTPIALDGLLQLAIHLVPVGLLPGLRRPAQVGLLVHLCYFGWGVSRR